MDDAILFTDFQNYQWIVGKYGNKLKEQTLQLVVQTPEVRVAIAFTTCTFLDSLECITWV